MIKLIESPTFKHSLQILQNQIIFKSFQICKNNTALLPVSVDKKTDNSEPQSLKLFVGEFWQWIRSRKQTY